MNILRTIVITLLLTTPMLTKAQISYATLIDGFWGEWEDSNTKVGGNYDNLILYKSYVHPSRYFMRIKLYNSKILFASDKTSKKIRKQILRENEWFTFDGEVEICESNARDFVWLFPFSEVLVKDKRYTKKVKVKIKGFKKRPTTYNIHFVDDKVGLGLRI